MAARAGVEPTTLQLKVIISTKAPPCPTSDVLGLDVEMQTIRKGMMKRVGHAKSKPGDFTAVTQKD